MQMGAHGNHLNTNGQPTGYADKLSIRVQGVAKIGLAGSKHMWRGDGEPPVLLE